jgi:hypothetical protein
MPNNEPNVVIRLRLNTHAAKALVRMAKATGMGAYRDSEGKFVKPMKPISHHGFASELLECALIEAYEKRYGQQITATP